MVYTGIVLVLGLALIGGILWAKNRSQHFAAANSNKTTVAQQDSSKDTEQSGPKQDTAQNQPSATSSTETHPATQPAVTPPTVPATGASNVAITVIGAMSIAFSLGAYVQTRRRLAALR